MIPDQYALEIQQKLVDAYATVVGEKPSDGGWIPDEKVCGKLAAYADKHDQHAVNSFLRLSVCAHLSRTRKSRTPFFVNSHLFAESALAYLKKHREYLGKMYGEAGDPTHFRNRVFADVYKAEKDYLSLACHYRVTGAKFDWGIVVPTVYWSLASQMFGRFKKVPTAAWEPMPVNYKDRKMRMGEARAAEYKKLKEDSTHRAIVRDAAMKAMLECAQGWAGQNHLVTFYYDDFGLLSHSPTSPLDPSLLRVTKPLIDRDNAMFDEAKKIWEKRGRTFKVPSAPVSDAKAPEKYQDLAMDPVMQKMLEATEED